MRRSGFKREITKHYLFLLSARDRIRDWLKAQGYQELIIPVLSPETVPDLNLESFSVSFQSVFDPKLKRELYLQTSPELLMKRMLVFGFEKIFYLGPAFRQGELSERHHPEFTMIEWYRVGADYLALMTEMESMLAELFGIKKPIARITMREAMISAGGFDFLEFQELRKFARFLKEKIKGLQTKGMDWEDLFERALIEWLEPWLKNQGAIFLYDWPRQFAMQGKLKKEDPRVCERFELYINGLEIANGYSEETDAKEMQKRFEVELRKRKRLKRRLMSLPEKFLASLKLGLGDCAGVSLGLERLCLALLGLDSLDSLLPFREI